MHRRSLFAATVLGCVVTLALIAAVPTFAPAVVLAVLAFCLSGGFAMALGLLSEYASDAAGSARLTAMAFSITYTVAAFGPFIAGAIMDTIDSWTLIFWLLAGVTLVQLVTVAPLRKGVRID